jgi:hypothetical protein
MHKQFCLRAIMPLLHEGLPPTICKMLFETARICQSGSAQQYVTLLTTMLSLGCFRDTPGMVLGILLQLVDHRQDIGEFDRYVDARFITCDALLGVVFITSTTTRPMTLLEFMARACVAVADCKSFDARMLVIILTALRTVITT